MSPVLSQYRLSAYTMRHYYRCYRNPIPIESPENAYFPAKIGFDTAENEPAKSLQKCTHICFLLFSAQWRGDAAGRGHLPLRHRWIQFRQSILLVDVWITLNKYCLTVLFACLTTYLLTCGTIRIWLYILNCVRSTHRPPLSIQRYLCRRSTSASLSEVTLAQCCW